MNNSNSFNICPRCGTANSLSAKYCYQCGSQLKVPEEPVVCSNCHSVNTSMANFCRTCGAAIKVGAQTKICPRCRKEVGIEQNQCKCGYSFATVRVAQPAPDVAVNPRTGKEYSPEAISMSKNTAKRAGRVAAFFALIIAALFLYVLFAPTGYMFDPAASKTLTWQPEFLAPLNAFTYPATAAGSNGLIGFTDYFATSLEKLINGTAVEISDYVMLGLVGIAALCVVVHLIVCLVRIFTGKKSKRANIIYLILAILFTLIAAFTVMLELNITFAIDLYTGLNLGVLPGYGWCVLAGYFVFFFFYSLFAKQKKIKA